MSDFEKLASRYIDCWNETDRPPARAAIDALWADDGRYSDPMAIASGRAEIDTTIAAVQAQFAGLEFRLVGPVDGHHDQCRFAWELVPEGAGTDPTIEEHPMPYFETTDGVTLFYRDWGTGLPALFVPSWSLSSLMWQYQMAHLDHHGVRCIAYDRRGHGRSDDPGGGFDYDTLADDLAALIEHLYLRDVTLIGHSMGGAEIVRYLSRHGDTRVARIALVAAALPFMLKTDDNPDGTEPAAFRAARAGWRNDFPLALAEIAPAFFGDDIPGCSVSPQLQEWLIDDTHTCSLKAVLECNRAISETDFRQELPPIRVPTLVIHGDSDASCPLELSGVKAAQLIPASRLVIYENAPHGLFLTHMDRLNADLLDGFTGTTRPCEHAGPVNEFQASP